MKLRREVPLRDSHAGFTLIELMITVVIVAVLATIAYPSYRAYIVRSNRTAAQSDLMSLAQTLEQIHTQSGTYQPGGISPTLPFTRSPQDPSRPLVYNIALTAITSDTFTLGATPVGGQAQDGRLEIDATGAKRWDSNNNAAFDATENHW